MVELSLRVPAALAISRALDTLSVAVDPASFGLTQLAAHPTQWEAGDVFSCGQ